MIVEQGTEDGLLWTSLLNNARDMPLCHQCGLALSVELRPADSWPWPWVALTQYVRLTTPFFISTSVFRPLRLLVPLADCPIILPSRT